MHDYVRLVPSDRGAEIRLGLLYIDNRQLKAAFDTLEDALRLADKSVPKIDEDPATAAKIVRDARLKLVKDVTMKIGPVEAMKAHLDILLEGAIDENKRRKRKGEKPQGDAELLDLYGQALVYGHNETDACEIFQDAISIAPDRVDSYLHLASVIRGSLHQEAEADAVIEPMIGKVQGSISVKLLDKDPAVRTAAEQKRNEAYEKYVYYFLAQGEKDKVDKAFNKARELLKLVPDDPRGLLLTGRCYYVKQDYDKAEEYLRKGIKASKDTDDLAGWYKLLAESQEQSGKIARKRLRL